MLADCVVNTCEGIVEMILLILVIAGVLYLVFSDKGRGWLRRVIE